jgi:hypothetical protein
MEGVWGKNEEDTGEKEEAEKGEEATRWWRRQKRR